MILDGIWSVGRLYVGYLSIGRMGRWDNRACVYACVYVVIMHVCVVVYVHLCFVCACVLCVRVW